MKVAGIAVIMLEVLCLPLRRRYAVATQSEIIASVWLLHEKYLQRTLKSSCVRTAPTAR